MDVFRPWSGKPEQQAMQRQCGSQSLPQHPKTKIVLPAPQQPDQRTSDNEIKTPGCYKPQI